MVHAIRSIGLSTISSVEEIPGGKLGSNSSPACSSSYRSSMRRMRTETPSMLPTFSESLENESERFQHSVMELDTNVREGRYTEAFSVLSDIEAIMNGPAKEKIIESITKEFPVNASEVRAAIDHLELGILSQVRAYLFVMNGDQNALAEHDLGYKNLQLAVKEVMAMARKMELSDFPDLSSEQVADFEKFVEIEHLIARGFLASGLNAREIAIENFRSGFSLWTDFASGAAIDSIFLIKVLEQKLQSPLLPPSSDVDEQDPRSLFVAGRYNEAIQLISSMPEDEQCFVQGIRIGSMALLGQYEEALEQFENPIYNSCISDFEEAAGKALISVLRGELEKAKEIALGSPSGFIYPILLLTKS